MNIEKDTNKELEEINKKISVALEEESDIELREAYVQRAEYYRSQLALEECIASYQLAIDKTAGAQKKLEYNLVILQIHFETKDWEPFAKYLEVCQKLNEEGGDWEKRNKLKVYDGIWMMLRRDLAGAAKTFLSCIDTFNAPEVISFNQLVFLGAVLGLVTLPRSDLKKKVFGNSEVIAILREDSLFENFMNSLYNRRYDSYFSYLGKISS